MGRLSFLNINTDLTRFHIWALSNSDTKTVIFISMKKVSAFLVLKNIEKHVNGGSSVYLLTPGTSKGIFKARHIERFIKL